MGKVVGSSVELDALVVEIKVRLDVAIVLGINRSHQGGLVRFESPLFSLLDSAFLQMYA
jgi:hypothetical protein